HRQAIVFFARGVFAHLERAGIRPELLRGRFDGARIVGFLHGGGAVAHRTMGKRPDYRSAAKAPSGRVPSNLAKADCQAATAAHRLAMMPPSIRPEGTSCACKAGCR